MIKIDPPHIPGSNTQEQLQQAIRYLCRLAEQLNIELNAELDGLRQREE